MDLFPLLPEMTLDEKLEVLESWIKAGHEVRDRELVRSAKQLRSQLLEENGLSNLSAGLSLPRVSSFTSKRSATKTTNKKR